CRDGAALGDLLPDRALGGREPRRGAGRRGRVRPAGVAPGARPPAGEGGRTGAGGAEEGPAEEGAAAAVPQLPQARLAGRGEVKRTGSEGLTFASTPRPLRKAGRRRPQRRGPQRPSRATGSAW